MIIINVVSLQKDNKIRMIMKSVKFFTAVVSLVFTSFCGLLLTSCNDDLQRSRVLFGEWQGYWGMYYEYLYMDRSYIFTSYSTDLVFYPQHEYATYGDGYQVDWYSVGPYSRISMHFYWEVRNGRIYLDYPGYSEYNAEIYDYFLNDFEFYGYFGSNGERFDMVKLASYNWAPYRQYNYYCWRYDDWSWNGYDGPYYTRSTEDKILSDNQNPVLSDGDIPNEGRIIRIGNHMAEGK